jgi:hypothetical protein
MNSCFRWAVVAACFAFACDPRAGSPRAAELALCWSDASGACRPTSGVNYVDAASEASRTSGDVGDDGGSNGLPRCLPSLGAGVRVGDDLYATVNVKEIPDEQERRLELIASGTLEFDDAEATGRTHFTRDIFTRKTSSPIVVPIRAVRTGPGSISLAAPFANIPALKADVVERTSTGIRDVQFVLLQGTKTQARLRLCSTLRPPNSVSIQALRGTVANDGKVPLDADGAGVCPPGYRSEGSIMWTGGSEHEVFTILGTDGVRECNLRMPKIVTALGTPRVTDARWADGEEGKAVGGVEVTLQAQTTAGPEPIANVAVTAVVLGSAFSVENPPDTDALGRTTLTITAPRTARSVSLSILVDARFRTLLSVPGPSGESNDAGAGADAM